MLVLLEKIKKVSDHKVSYTQVKRAELGAGQSDSFQVTITERQMFKCMTEEGKANTCKSFFSGSINALKSSPHLLTTFRWRFERVHACLKVQKPYVILSAALECKAGQPVHVA